MKNIERRIYKVTLNDIKSYVYLCSKDIHNIKYVMIENNFLNNPESSSEIYIDSIGLDRANCSATMFGKISPLRTYLIDQDICGKQDKYVELNEFCEYLYNYIKEEYRERYLINKGNDEN